MIPPVAGVSVGYSMTGASGPKPPAKRMNDLFTAIDTAGAGSITASQFQAAFASKNPPANFKAFGADKTWAALDPNARGAVSQPDFVNTMTGLMTSLRGYAARPKA